VTPPPGSARPAPFSEAKTPEEKVGRALLARHLVRRGKEAVRDADVLLAGKRLRAATLCACDAIADAVRALLVPLGLDASEPAAGAALFDRQLVATDLVSRPCGLAVHRALRARREIEQGDIPVLYDARAIAVRDGAVLLLAEAEIVVERLLADVPLTEPGEGMIAPPPPDEDRDE
jgi:uncharacterized protein (UPF0332 family)